VKGAGVPLYSYVVFHLAITTIFLSKLFICLAFLSASTQEAVILLLFIEQLQVSIAFFWVLLDSSGRHCQRGEIFGTSSTTYFKLDPFTENLMMNLTQAPAGAIISLLK
jgi:hypothetical protein